MEHYTIIWAKSKGIIGRKGDLATDFTDFHGLFGHREGEFEPRRREDARSRHRRIGYFRIYRMIGISAVEGALRESGGDSLWIKTGRALSKRASSGPAGFDPATLSPCEAWFGSEFRRQEEEHEGAPSASE